MIEVNAELFRAKREKLGKSLRDVSAATGINPQTILNIEKGQSDPTVSTAFTLARYYRIPTSNIVLSGALRAESV